MTVTSGNIALASDYNTLKDEINKWFDDPDPTMSWGDGDQTWGWGGSAVDAVTQELITAVQMNAFVDRCNIGVDTRNNVTGQLSQIVAGDQITAAASNAIETKSDLIAADRLNVDASTLSITTAGTMVVSTTWSSATTLAEGRYTFVDFNRARYFFNSGGAFAIIASITGYSTGSGWDGAGFDEIFTEMGTVWMNCNDTHKTGTGGSGSAIGYYDLTTAYQTIYDAAGTGVYSDAYLHIAARRSASGHYIDVRITGTPGSGRSVDGSTTTTNQLIKLDNQSSGAASLTITAPSYASFL